MRGDVSALDAEQALAWSGARAASAYGESVTSEIVADLAQAGISIHSGGAYGIDGTAHRAALAVGESTVAWLAGGVDRLYPTGHTHLLERVAAAPGSAVVSELPLFTAPTRWRFITRARLIAASTQATIIAEAGWRSGALNAGSQATALGRPLGAIPGPITSACNAGCHRLIREYGTRAITSTADAHQLLQTETRTTEHLSKARRAEALLGPAARRSASPNAQAGSGTASSKRPPEINGTDI